MTATETRNNRALASELKFLVSPDVADEVRRWARAHMKSDPFGAGPNDDGYTTTTLYTDTDDWAVFERRGSYGRSKYRVRRYGTSDVVFLERKLRTASLLSKRRTPVPLGELALMGSPLSSLHGWAGEWFAHRLAARRLEPVCQVAYDRTARVMPSPHGLTRLTVDSGLRARPAHSWQFELPSYTPVLEDRQILELKFAVELPALFKRLLTEFGLEPCKVSKYRLSAAALSLAPGTLSHEGAA